MVIVRLNAYLARAGVTSRRGADELIKAGKVTVNDLPGQLNSEVSENDRVELDGKSISVQKLRYILMNKPRGTVTTLSDPHGRRKILDMLSIPQRVVPVGRLDYDTTGALLLTNDGDIAYRLMHPSFEVDKVYEAHVEGKVSKDKLTKIRQGVKLEDGVTAPATADIIGKNLVKVTVHEGKKHQVKRMLAAIGLNVTALHRPDYGPLKLGDLQPGEWRNLTKAEVDSLKELTG